MTVHKTIFGTPIELDALTEEEQRLAARLLREVEAQIQHLSRTQLQQYQQTFYPRAAEELADIARSLPEESRLSLHKKRLITDLLTDLHNRIRFAAGLVSNDYATEPPFRPKQWTGQEEAPVYTFHVSKNVTASDGALEFGAELVRTYDRKDGGFVDELDRRAKENGRTMIGAFPAPSSETSLFIAQLLRDYGDEIDYIFREIFQRGFELGMEYPRNEVIDYSELAAEISELPTIQQLYEEVGHDIHAVIHGAITTGIHFGRSGRLKGHV